MEYPKDFHPDLVDTGGKSRVAGIPTVFFLCSRKKKDTMAYPAGRPLGMTLIGKEDLTKYRIRLCIATSRKRFEII